MLICFTGLHAAGKSYFLNKIPEYFDFKIFDKKQILRRLYYLETGLEDDGWNKWYGEKFESDSKKIVSQILACLPLDENVVLDAIHSSYEWELIHQMVPDSYLALIVTPLEEREERWEKREIIPRDLRELDRKRIRYWHNFKAQDFCLPTHVSWAFDGSASEETNIKLFQEFLDYHARRKENNIKVLRKKKKDETNK